MIVSGFTQRTSPPTDEELIGFSNIHRHCLRCRQAHCKHPVDDVDSCAMTSCHACGFRFHECKTNEHALTCQEERVPCINALYGCPHFMKRSSLPTHLPVCPASVVCCAEEWSRWPMYTKDKGVKHPLPSTKTYFDCGQLDVALAMRDQRMLIDSLRAPAKLRRSLRNPLTQKYPAAPLTHRSPSQDSSDHIASGGTSQTVSDDDSDAPWNLTQHKPGLKESISRHLVSVSRETKEDLISALGNKMSSNLSSPHSPFTGISEAAAENAMDSSLSSTSKLVQCSITEHAHSREPSEDIDRTDQNSPSMVQNERSSMSSERDRDLRTRSRSVSVLRDPGGSQLHKILGVKLGEENEDNSICLHKILGVSLTHDVINKYVGKSASMYTFICSQNFRRDQYKWHFRNVHDEIVPQLDGYLEHRCPLAHAGCTFSFQKLVPGQPNTALYFSCLQESFGVRSTEQPYYSLSPQSPSSSSANTTLNVSDNDRQVLNSNTSPLASGINNSNSNPGPSISNLADFDKEFDQLKVKVDDGFFDFNQESKGQGLQPSSPPPSSSSLTPNQKRHTSPNEDVMTTSTSSSPSTMTSVNPVVFTAFNPDSKVLLVYNVEESDVSSLSLSLIDLPFELLQQIARHLDSLSLCNLSLTCRHLRDVCCSLLDDLGIVLLNWERQKVGDKISWKVVDKRWTFSTSFEPIREWKFNDNHMSITDHLKVCPFNQDKVVIADPIPILGFC